MNVLRPRVPPRAVLIANAIIGVLLPWTTSTLAGGGPENVLLVVNSNDPGSLTVANQFIQLRCIPPSNVVYLSWHGPQDKITVNSFRDDLLKPILAEIDQRHLKSQIDYVIYSSGFPWSINFQDDIPKKLRDLQFYEYPEGSLSGLTYLSAAVMSKDVAEYIGSPTTRWFTSNRYMRLREQSRGKTFEVPVVPTGEYNGVIPGAPNEGPRTITQPIDPSSVGSHGFRSSYGWGPNGELMKPGAAGISGHYLLSTVLGVTNGRGNTVPEILSYLERSAAADGTMPAGTIYFMDNAGVRATTRHPPLELVADELKQLGVAAKILQGEIPQDCPDVQGLLCGAAEYDWKASGSTIRPGAICESLTSWAGNFETKEQTPLSVFLRFGAAGSSGTVTEPRSIQNKFPYATIHLHYARGCTLAEAYYQSLYAPYQLLIVGDPLCRPWANISQVKAQGAAAGDTLQGKITLRATATLPHGGAVDRFEWFVDGERAGNVSADEKFELNTALYADGAHELRVVGIEASAIESQGRKMIPVRFNNNGRTIQFDVAPQTTVHSGALIKLIANAPGCRGVAFFQNRRVVAKFEGERGAPSIDSAMLGEGPVTLQAIGFGRGGVDTEVMSTPLQFTIEK